MTDKFKDQDSMLPAATDDKKKIGAKPAKKSQVIINPPEKLDPQRGFNERFQYLRAKHSVVLEKKTEIVLQSKASRAEFPQDVIEQVYKRGFKALPLNTELTREQYAMNRVNSFIAGGAAMVEDYDLLPITERVHTRIGMKGTGGGARPHIKREKSPYNGRTVFHVVDAKGIVKHSTGDEFEAKKHLASKYNSYMKESALSPMKRFEGTRSLVKTYKGDTPGEGKTTKLKGNQVKLDKNNNNKLDAEDFKLLRREEVKKGLYYYVNLRKKAGTSRDKDSEKAPSAQDWKNAAKTAKEEVDLDEAIKINTRVTIHAPGKSYHGIKGRIGEIRHGAHKGAEKSYTVFHGEEDAVQVSKRNIRVIKEDAAKTAISEDLRESDVKTAYHKAYLKHGGGGRFPNKAASDKAYAEIGKTHGPKALSQLEKLHGTYIDAAHKAGNVYKEMSEDQYSDRSKQRFKSQELQHELGRETQSSKSSAPHSVHINGRKWKTFGSESHATGVANKIKGATVHKEQVNVEGND